jgi:hypothetical protein
LLGWCGFHGADKSDMGAKKDPRYLRVATKIIQSAARVS